jgi:type II secretory pathway component PulL
MHKLSVLALLVMILAPLPAAAYTQEDADACTPDAFKLCQAAIPDADRVRDCLVQNKRGLSAACAAVMSRPHDASTSPDVPQNIQRVRR